MADAILRHGRLPFIYAGEEGRGSEADDLMQFGANDGDDGVVGKIPDIFCVRSGEEAAQQGAVFGRAMRKFIVDKGGGEEAFAFAARNKEAEAGRERLANLASVAETTRVGGT